MARRTNLDLSPGAQQDVVALNISVDSVQAVNVGETLESLHERTNESKRGKRGR